MTPEEVELTDRADVLTDYDFLDLQLVCFPNGALGDVVNHSAAAADDKRAIFIQNIAGSVAAETGLKHICCGAADKETLIKLALLTAELIDALICKTVHVEGIGNVVEDMNAAYIAAACEVARSAGLEVGCPAGILDILGLFAVGADLTDKLVGLGVIIVVMLILTDGNAHGIAVIYGRIAG